MIKDFESVKTQLSELAGVINLFKSEAVQLRIIELILGSSHARDLTNAEADEGAPPKRIIRQRQNRKANRAEKSPEPKKRKMASGTGAPATLTQLVAQNYFDKPRTINDIIQHCKHQLARTFKANEFSGKLARMVRNKDLTRKKNADNQYEYKKP